MFEISKNTEKEFGMFGLSNETTAEQFTVARNVLQTFCSGADLSILSEADIQAIVVAEASTVPLTDLPKLADTKSEIYTNLLANIGKKVCDAATAKKGTATNENAKKFGKYLLWGAGIVVGGVIIKKIFF